MTLVILLVETINMNNEWRIKAIARKNAEILSQFETGEKKEEQTKLFEELQAEFSKEIAAEKGISIDV